MFCVRTTRRPVPIHGVHSRALAFVALVLVGTFLPSVLGTANVLGDASKKFGFDKALTRVSGGTPARKPSHDLVLPSGAVTVTQSSKKRGQPGSSDDGGGAKDKPSDSAATDGGREERAAAGAEKKKKPANDTPMGSKPANLQDNDKDFQLYLARLMIAESGGRDTARNPRSTAVGPYQFIKSTFLSVVRRNFPDDVKGMTNPQILALRTDRTFARKAAAAYSRENAAHLAAEGLKTNYGNLRLAFLMGPSGAVRVLKAKPELPLSKLLDRSVLRANPFIRRLTAGELVARCHREISIDPSRQLSVAGLPKVNRGPRIKVRCNLSRPSCRKWLALKRKRLAAKARRAGKKAKRR